MERPSDSSFRWPSRRSADAVERAAGAAAEAGLERLRARAPKPVEPTPPAAAVDAEPPPPAVERGEVVAEAPQPHVQEPESEPRPAPAPWDEELDELTEKLVAELRRDLGPEPS